MDYEILKEFIDESKGIVKDCLELLETIEGHYEKVTLLESYGNNLDRIMGGATTIALDVGQDHVLYLISDYASICKNVGYKASQIKVNEPFFNVCVAFLIDATEVLQFILEKSQLPTTEIKDQLPEEFISRLKWILTQFNVKVRTTVGDKASKQIKGEEVDVDKLLNRFAKKKK